MLARFEMLAQACGVANVQILAGSCESRGEIGPIICSTIDEAQIDHVVVGRSGMSKVKKLLLGSVSRYIVDNATCDVTVVKTVHHSLEMQV